MSRKVVLLVLFTAILVFSGCDSVQSNSYAREAETAVDQTEIARQIIRSSLTSSEPRLRSQAIEIVAENRMNELMPLVSELLTDQFVPVRYSALIAIGDMDYKPARFRVEKLLGDGDENVRIAASYAMYKLTGAQEHLDNIRKFTGSDNQTVRANAVTALGKAGNEQDIRPLYDIMYSQSSDEKVKFQAAEALAALGDEKIYLRLWTMLISAFADDRAMGIKAMAELGSLRAQQAVETMLNDDIAEVRLIAAGELGKMGIQAGAVEIVDIMRNMPSGDPDARERINILAARGIGHVGTENVRRFLPGLLNNESPYVRLAAAGSVIKLN